MFLHGIWDPSSVCFPEEVLHADKGVPAKPCVGFTKMFSFSIFCQHLYNMCVIETAKPASEVTDRSIWSLTQDNKRGLLGESPALSHPSQTPSGVTCADIKISGCV